MKLPITVSAIKRNILLKIGVGRPKKRAKRQSTIAESVSIVLDVGKYTTLGSMEDTEAPTTQMESQSKYASNTSNQVRHRSRKE